MEQPPQSACDAYDRLQDSEEYARWQAISRDEEPERALECAGILAKRFPNSPLAWWCVGEGRLFCEDEDGALTALYKAIELAEALRAAKPECVKSKPSGPVGGPEWQQECANAIREVSFALHEAFVLQASWLRIGEIRLFRGEVDAARSAYQHIAGLYPHRPEAWRRLLEIYAEQGDVRGSIRAYRNLAGGSEPTVEHWNGLANSLLTAGRAAVAEAVCRKALHAGMGNSQTSLLRAQALCSLAEASRRRVHTRPEGQLEFSFMPSVLYMEALRACRHSLATSEAESDPALDLHIDIVNRLNDNDHDGPVQCPRTRFAGEDRSP